MTETLGYSAAEIAALDPKGATMMERCFQIVDYDQETQNLVEQASAAKENESGFFKRIKNSPRKIIEGGGRNRYYCWTQLPSIRNGL